MLCPAGGQATAPGADECARCLFPLASVDSQLIGGDAVAMSVLQDRVRTVKVRPPVTIPIDGKLGLALDRMVEHSVGALLVVDADGKLVGIRTERDYLRKGVGIVRGYA